ncbi:hydroxymethylbilane synthase [Paenibacillus cellulosilyticus]|uniref:Porphobilinogen deaminase n=1 Tax=Paenibacillus cellulosilyticus TaxID=375489 RepID=A0A2V2YGL0_9BACL|nr:hydroxymethylbilane synthase [Paenibacillus cellulosilyticus]PWV92023.1 hydroxymethylbilane synthase [Paenibacillus cellulosilyticus]QKS46705.1 hydroxymethylbilane synthase [Paenibacillus cellulosilyticus]
MTKANHTADGSARVIRVGTRQSALALTQTGQVIDQLKQLSEQHGLPYTFEIVKIVTKGDRILDVTLSKVGGKGLFVKEIEQALIDGEIDMAVHSMKDMPFELPEGLMNGAVPKRVDPRDVIITSTGGGLSSLPEGAKIGTSSLRRASQLKSYRPDIELVSIRGNIDSRIRKLETEEFDAIVLAAAGLQRMGWESRIHDRLPIDICVPAVGQGALGIECRESDAGVRELLSLLNDPVSELAVRAERSFLGALNGGCQIPIGAHAVVTLPAGLEEKSVEGAVIELVGIVGSPDGAVLLKEIGKDSDPEALGLAVADKLRASGADDILAQVRG